MSEVISPPAPLDRACVLSATALSPSMIGPGALNERPRRAAHAPPSAVLAGRKGLHLALNRRRQPNVARAKALEAQPPPRPAYGCRSGEARTLSGPSATRPANRIGAIGLS